jgi:hypothetical protein
LGEATPSWLCGGKINRGLGPVTEVGFNALNTRMGFTMTNTQKLKTNRTGQPEATTFSSRGKP